MFDMNEEVLIRDISSFQGRLGEVLLAVRHGQRAEAMLCGVAAAMYGLLTVRNAGTAIDRALSLIGPAADVDTIAVLEKVTYDSLGEEVYEPCHIWSAPDVDRVHSDGVRAVSSGELASAGWHEILQEGQTFSASTRDVSGPIREILEKLQLGSILLAPIEVDGKRWGAIGFFHSDNDYEWNHDEQYVILAMAACIEVAVERSRVAEMKAELQRRMAQCQKLESLSMLAKGIAHDANNLVFSVQGSLEKEAIRRSWVKSSEMYKNITKSVNGVVDLMRHLHTYAGGGVPRKGKLRIDRVVLDTMHMIQSSIPEHVDIDLTDVLPLPEISADPVQLRQVIINLAINAIEAIGDAPGTIKLRTDMVEVSDALLDLAYKSDDVSSGPHVLIEVADSGPGMDEADIAKAFDPSYTTKEKNRGLGLATVLSAVRNHGGAILVDSKPDAGTRFCVLIPKRETQSKKFEDI